MEITKTVLSLMLVIITISTAITTTIAAVYAGGDDDNNNGDGNKQKAEDDSAAAIADCDKNDVERAGFDCIAIATNDVEIETEPPEEETTLAVCKEVNDPTGEVEPNDFVFAITSGPNTIRIEGQPPGDCQPVDDIFPGEYTVTEEVITDAPDPDSVSVEGCTLVDNDPPTATGEIQAGGTERCVFINNYEEESATLSVCKEVRFAEDISPGDFDFTVTGNDPFPDEFEGSANCVDVDIGPGEYTVSEVPPSLGGRFLAVSIESGSDCEQDPGNQRRVTGEIQAGETQTCTFINSIGD